MLQLDKRSKILFAVLLGAMVVSLIFLYIRIYVRQDFDLYAYVDCDPAMESCFIYECDPAWDDWCIEEPEDPRENIWPYKFFFKSAKDTSKPEDANCDPIEAQDCPEIECVAGDPSCEITCDPLVDGEDACIGPGETFFEEVEGEEESEGDVETMEEGVGSDSVSEDEVGDIEIEIEE